MTGAALVGVDVGGGGIRGVAELGERSAHVLDDTPLPRARGGIDVPRLVPRLNALLRGAGDRLGAHRFARVAIGLTGLPDLIGHPDELVRLLRNGSRIGSVLVAADALTTHVGALGGRSGVVVAAGTGSVALGTDFRQLWQRGDGWGYLLGDDGSGAWVGQRGLRCALRSRDGRPGGSPELLTRLEGRFGDAAELESRVYTGTVPPAALLASFAPDVAAAARAGDEVALRIWDEAGTRLGETAVAASPPGLARRFSWGGRLFDVGALLQDPFRAEVLRQVPDADFTAPLGSSAAGALTLARAGADTVPRQPYLYLYD
ncbi:N-acetylglucosamine kinase [Nocardiopsis nanhaiensis]